MKLSPKVRSGAQDVNLVWRVVPGFEDYEVSEYGDLRKGSRYIVPQRKVGSGRKYYPIYRNGKLRMLYAHQVVALAFLGPKPFAAAEVCHNDGFFHNNHYSNLRYDTRLGNSSDDLRHKLHILDRSGFHISASDRKRAFAAAMIADDELAIALDAGRKSKRCRRSRPSKRVRQGLS